MRIWTTKPYANIVAMYAINIAKYKLFRYNRVQLTLNNVQIIFNVSFY